MLTRLLPRFPMPRSLHRQFLLAAGILVLLIVGGGVTVVQGLQASVDTARQLTEDRLALVQQTHELVVNTLLIDREARRMLAANQLPQMQDSYDEILRQLAVLDIQVATLAQAGSDSTVLGLHQAGQLFRNSAHIVASLREEALLSATNLPAAETQDANLRAEHLEALSLFQTEMSNQALNMVTAARELSDHFTQDFRQAVSAMAESAQRYRHRILALLAGSLLVAWLIYQYYLKGHIIGRLAHISYFLRHSGHGDGAALPTQGSDEIAAMARAVEGFLADSRKLVDTQNSLRQSEGLMRTITHAVQNAVLLMDDAGLIRFVNPAATRLFGFQADEMIGQNWFDLLIPPSDHPSLLASLDQQHASLPGEAIMVTPLEIVALRKDGSRLPIALYTSQVNMGEHDWIVAAAIDHSAHRAKVQALAQLAETDPLTGIGNRRSFLNNAEQALSQARQDGTRLFFLMLDLDHFKAVNDNYGHAAGDKVLQAFAEICIHNLRDADLFGRLGGEEFAALMADMDINSAKRVAERIRTSFTEVTVETEGRQVTIATSVSIGLAPVDLHSDTIIEVMQRADAALYRAKTQGRNRVEVMESSHPPSDIDDESDRPAGYLAP